MNAQTTGSGGKAARRAGIALIVFLALAALIFWLAPDNLYLWAVALHVIAIISWMAGMLYLPRLFVYHADVEVGSDTDALLQLMERRLLRVIMNPAMIVAWAVGLWLAWSGGHWTETWFVLKFILVLGMSAAHGTLAKGVRLFADGRNERSARQWRIINEVPTVLMIAIVILVIVKPFL
jgi:putative membrane protein